jgi:hypothetical protein
MEDVQKVTIFLDIDGVLLDDIEKEPLALQIQEKLIKLFGEKKYTGLEHRIARSHFFSKDAVTHFESLLAKVLRVAKPEIVLSSSWRHHGSIEEIKTQMFAGRKFAKFIVDKTPLDDSWQVANGEKPLFEEFHKFDQFPLVERSLQIHHWLKEHKEVQSFVIIDDCNLAFSERFPKHFVHITKGLFSKRHASLARDILVGPGQKST